MDDERTENAVDEIMDDEGTENAVAETKGDEQTKNAVDETKGDEQTKNAVDETKGDEETKNAVDEIMGDKETENAVDEIMNDEQTENAVDETMGDEQKENAEYQHHNDDPHFDTLTEIDIVRFKDKPDLWFRKIQHSDTTKTGKGKKSNRVYNTYQWCGFCYCKMSNWSQHIIRRHANVPVIKDIFKLEKEERQNALHLERLLQHDVCEKREGRNILGQADIPKR